MNVVRKSCVLLLWGVAFCYGQEQLPKADARILGKQQTSGYSIEVSQPYKSLRRKWWNFLKGIGKIRLRRDYWELHFKERLILYAAILRDEKGANSSLYLGLSAGISEEKAAKYTDELKKTLVSFVASEERAQLEKRLQRYERALSKKSTQIERLRLRSKQLQAKGGEPGTAMLQNIRDLQIEIDALKKQHSEVIGRLSVLGDKYQ